MRPSVEEVGLRCAEAWALRSTCLRRAVGCVLLDARGRVLATGHNGVASGQPHCNESVVGLALNANIGGHNVTWPHACPGAGLPSGQGLDLCHAIHAEQNALMFCRDSDAIATCCTTTSPCVHCLKMLLNTGCRTIAFREEYAQPEARALWEGAGRDWIKMEGPHG